MKKKWLIILGGLAAAGIVAALLVYFFVYNKPHKDYSKAKPDFEVEAIAFFEEFRTNAAASSARYNGKVIAITGQLSSVEVTDEQVVALFEIDEGMFGSEGVRCVLIPEKAETLMSIPPGSTITIKGHCTGYNETDVILEHCSIAI
jgi:hypothetical protein